MKTLCAVLLILAFSNLSHANELKETKQVCTDQSYEHLDSNYVITFTTSASGDTTATILLTAATLDGASEKIDDLAVEILREGPESVNKTKNYETRVQANVIKLTRSADGGNDWVQSSIYSCVTNTRRGITSFVKPKI